MCRIFPLLLILLALDPATAFAWGDTGHRVVCEIAYAELDRGARREVNRLVRLDPQYRTFREACLWADGPPRQRGPDHYVNFPRDTRVVESDDCGSADSCLFSAIEQDSEVLASETSSDQERLEALKLLAHWIGDIHQPMHTSFGDDRGANRVQVFIDSGPQPEQTNLHAVWDYWIIAARLGSDDRALAYRLRSAVTDAERTRWSADSPVDWANESFQIATASETRYCVKKRDACWYSTNNRRLDRGELSRAMTIGDDYASVHAATVEARLVRAGIRLGALLNRLLEP